VRLLETGTRQELDLPTGAKTTYQYDGLNRLTQLVNWSGDGNRVSEQVGETTTFYLVDTCNPGG
jgi:uncharacterized protein RhaS with RHS repeats